MGYTTEFSGSVAIVPPLSAEEIAYLRKFNGTRRMNCTQGPYYVDRGGDFGQSNGPDVLDYNHAPDGQPGLWCQWTPTDDGAAIEWDGGEKFYDSVEWMTYLIKHFIGNEPLAKAHDPVAFGFLQGHVLNGEIDASGEERGDLWRLVVTDNEVVRQDGSVSYG